MLRKTIIRLVGMVLFLVFIIATIMFTTKLKKKVSCEDIAITFTENDRFVTEKEVLNRIKKSGIKIIGCLADTLDTDKIEYTIMNLPWVKNAEVFKGYIKGDSTLLAGAIKINIRQRVPIMRVQKLDKGFYVDTDGVMMPFSSSATTNVPVYSGNINNDSINSELLVFANFINENPFWKSQIVQVYVLSNNELMLIPRAGDHRIEFGQPVNIEKKFRNLMAVYHDGFSHGTWDKYKKVSLKFNNQVVCTRK